MVDEGQIMVLKQETLLSRQLLTEIKSKMKINRQRQNSFLAVIWHLFTNMIFFLCDKIGQVTLSFSKMATQSSKMINSA